MKRLLLLTAFILALYPLTAQEKSPMELKDIFDLEYISDPQISPDGDKIIYVRNFKDIMSDKNYSNLWIINSDGSSNRALTTGNQNDHSPRWSHDGSRIVFRSNMKDEKSKLYLMWVGTREIQTLLNPPHSASGVAWSPDDRYLAFSMFVPEKGSQLAKMPAKPEGATWSEGAKFIDDLNYRSDGRGYLKPGHQQLFVLPTDGGSPRQLTTRPFDHGSPVWSRDGKKLFFSSNMTGEEALQPMNSELYALRIQDTTLSQLTKRNGPDRSPVVSPDGKTLAYLGFDDAYKGYQMNNIYLLDLQSGESRELATGLDRNPSDLHWDAKGKGLYFQYDDGGESRIGYTDLNGKVEEKAKDLGGLSMGRPYTGASYSVASDGTLAFTLGSEQHPADLGVRKGSTTRRLTRVNEDLFSYRKLGKVEEMTWKSSHDGREIEGWLVYPPNFEEGKKYPLILEIHGGPFAAYGPHFSAEVQLYAAAGYAVLYTNPRGSASYGEEFGNLIHHNYPNEDYFDLMSGVDAVIEKGVADENRLYVTGGSGGGVLTAWIVGKTNRFKAAVVAKPVINWYSFVLYADNPAFFSKYWFPAKPWEDPEHYLKRSPLSYVDKVETPTLLLTGEADYRTPIAESEQFYAALKLEGVETGMVRIPGASHGIAAKPSHLVAKVANILAWFERYP